MANTPPDNSGPNKGAPDAPSAAGGAAAPGQPGQGRAGEAAGEAPKHHDDIIAALRAETADLKDRLLRAHAEVENIRKRSEREKEETAKYAITRLARDIVNVGDNFQRAIDAVPPDAVERDSALKKLPRRRNAYRARVAQRAGALRHPQDRAQRRAVQSTHAPWPSWRCSAPTCRPAPSCRCSRPAS